MRVRVPGVSQYLLSDHTVGILPTYSLYLPPYLSLSLFSSARFGARTRRRVRDQERHRADGTTPLEISRFMVRASWLTRRSDTQDQRESEERQDAGVDAHIEPHAEAGRESGFKN
jgi:hypothetical protein